MYTDLGRPGDTFAVAGDRWIVLVGGGISTNSSQEVLGNGCLAVRTRSSFCFHIAYIYNYIINPW